MQEISKFTDPSDSIELTLFDREIDSGDWRNFKIVAAGKNLPKQNWWIAFNRAEGRIVKNRDAGLLAEHRPAAYEWFLSEVTP